MAALIGGRYELIRPAGAGAEGTVFHARDLATNTDVAVKTRPLPDDGRDFELEAELLRNIKPHHGLPMVRDAFVDDGNAVLVMSWVEGTNLQELLNTFGSSGVGWEHALDAIEQVAAALEHLHGHHRAIVHGDVKPSNIIATSGGGFVLVDFGGATLAGSSHVSPGTRGYRAPERSAGEPPTTAADVFGLTATLYALMSGRPPRFGLRTQWRQLDADTGARLDAAIGAGLALRPEKRPTARGLINMLNARIEEGAAQKINLPRDLPPFVGRTRELAEVEAALGSSRVVSVTGRAGVGKSRLAIEAASRWRDRMSDGIWYVVVGEGSAGRIPERIGVAMNVREHADATIDRAVINALREREALLLFDGCDPAAVEVSAFVGRIIDACPKVRIITTSREPIAVEGAAAVPVGSLGSDAEDLFWDRIAMTNPELPRHANEDSARAICEALDGVPLAIELAAASSRDHPVDEIAKALQADEESDPITRALTWVEATLDPAAKTLFQGMAIMVSGCQADDAAAVLAGPDLDASEVLPALWRLVDRGLLIAEDVAGVVRYRMVDAIWAPTHRRFESSDRATAVREARLRWAADLTARAAAAMYSPGEPLWLARLTLELDNLRVTLAWGMETDPATTLRIVAAMSRIWYLHGLWREGRYWVERATEDAPDDPVTARALSGGAMLCEELGDYEASIAMYRRAEAIQRAHNAERDLTYTLDGYAYTMLAVGDSATAIAMYDEALEIATRIGNRTALAGALLGKGTVAAVLERWEEAIEWCQKALPIVRDHGDSATVALVLTTLAGAQISHGDFDEAERNLEEALELRRTIGDRMGESVTLNAMAEHARLAHGDLDRAREIQKRNLAIREELGHAAGVATMLNNLGAITEDVDEQMEILQRALDMRRALGNDVMTAIALCNITIPLRRMGEFDRCREHLIEAAGIYDRLGHTRGAGEAMEKARLVAVAAEDDGTAQRFSALVEELHQEQATTQDALDALRAWEPTPTA